MNKFLLTLSVLIPFSIFSYFQRAAAQTPSITIAQNLNNQSTLATPTPTIPPPTPNPNTNSNNTTSSSPTPPPIDTPTPTPQATSGYKNGTYSGSPEDAFYGTIQVQAVISGGKITSVNFLQAPNDRSTSMYINSQADPMLAQEAIQTQSANVNIISGATDSSQAFIQSLQTALDQAKS